MDWKKILYASLGVTAISWLLSWLYKYAQAKIPAIANGIATVTFAAVDVNVGQRVVSGVDTSVAGKFLGAHLGAFGGFQQIILLFISAIAIIVVGMYVNKLFDLGKSENSKFAWELTLGAVAIGLVFGYLSPSLGYLGTAVAYGIYFLIVSGVYSLARNWGLKNALPAPAAV